MAIGLPSSAKKIHKIIGRNNRAEYVLGTAYYYYLKFLTKTKSHNLNKENSAPIKPFELLEITPGEIKIRSRDKPYSNHLFPKISGGEWDRKPTDLSESPRYKSFYQHFVEGVEWSATDYYSNKKESFSKNESQYSRNTNQSFEQKLQRIDELYSSIKKDGYKKQKKLPRKANSVNDKIDHYLREFNEVTVNIGRKGQIILVNGNHRVTIAKILGIDKIPVRVLVRHKEWQQKRNQATKNPDKLEEKTKQHPDIRGLVE